MKPAKRVIWSLLETLARGLAAVWGNGMIVRAGLCDGAVAPEMSRPAGGVIGLGGKFVSQSGDKHGFGAKMFAENRLAHN